MLLTIVFVWMHSLCLNQLFSEFDLTAKEKNNIGWKIMQEQNCIFLQSPVTHAQAPNRFPMQHWEFAIYESL